MKEYIVNEIKKVNYEITGYKERIENLQQKYDRAVVNGDKETAARIKSQIGGCRSQITRLNRKLNDLKRELRYMDVEDDYSIHGNTIDKMLDGTVAFGYDRDFD
jgi:chromosome segregation ATPase